MKKVAAVLALLIGFAGLTDFALADGFGRAGFDQSTVHESANAPEILPTNIALPEIIPTTNTGGTDVVGQTLTVRPGVWAGSASTKTYRWHTIAGSTLGTGATFGPLTSAMVTACVGTTDPACGRIEVDETATNTAGSATVISDFVGPVETALPPATIGVTCGQAPLPSCQVEPTALPLYPANFLQNGHAIYPGCDIPPVAPNTSNPANVWYFDSLAGGTLASGATGHIGSPFKDIGGIYVGAQGFAAAGPTITSIQISGFSLIGTGFGSTQGGNTVTIDGHVATISTWTATTIVGTIPSGATAPGLAAGVGQLIVSVGTPTSVSSSFTPKGVGFGTTGVMYVSGVKMPTAQSWGNLGATVIMPQGLVIPTLATLEVDTGLFFGNGTTYGLTPTLTSVGNTFFINSAAHFGASQGTTTVTVGGVSVPSSAITVWNASQIQGTLPPSAPVPTTVNSVVLINGVGVPVTISSAGVSSMTIKGTGFGLGQGGVSVTAGGLPATSYSTWNNTTIVSPIPAGAGLPNTGNVVVAVGTNFAGIHAGDVIYVKNDPSGASLGVLNANSDYSTIDGTAGGGVGDNWTWLMADPAATAAPVITSIAYRSSAGFVVKGINVEENALDLSTPPKLNGGASMIFAAGSILSPTFDLAFEGMNLTSRKGHSNDPWPNTTYPQTDGNSNGTIVTASPYMGALENPPSYGVSAATSGLTKLFMTTGIPLFTGGFNTYVWSPGYYYQLNEQTGGPPDNTGIPNGSKLLDVQGRTDLTPQGALQAATALELTGGVTPIATATTVGTLPTGSPGDFGIVMPNTTAIQQIYQWTTAWTFVGNFLPQNSTGSVAAWFMQNNHNLWVANGSTGWTNLFAAYVDIAPCDPVADAATGCPSAIYPGSSPASNVVGCDPLVEGSGGCPGGTPPVWAGTTRGLGISTSEVVYMTPFMVMAPNAGQWTHVDWDHTVSGMEFLGAPGTNNTVPAAPNDVTGTSCLSVKDTTVRWMLVGIAASISQNIMFYNDKLNYRAGDGYEIFSSHRVIVAGGIVTNTSYQTGHPDIVQFGEDSVGTEASQFFGSAVVNLEGYTQTDPANLFPDFTQLIGSTDGTISGVYLADNIIIGSDNPVVTDGLWNVSVQNDVFFDNGGAGVVAMTSGNAKAGTSVSARPAFSLMSNNVANGELRIVNIPTFTITGTGFGATTGTISVGGLAVTVIPTWTASQIQGVLPVGAPVVSSTFTTTGTGFGTTQRKFTLGGSGFTATQGTVTINGTLVPSGNIVSWNNTTIVGYVPLGVIAPTTANTVTSVGTVSSVATVTATLTVTGVATPITTWGDTTITATVPPAATAQPTTGNVVVSQGTASSIVQTTNVTTSSGSVIGATTTSSTPCSADQSTVQGNVLLSLVNYNTGVLATANSTFCGAPSLGAGMINGSTAGIFVDMLGWSPQDRRTEVVGVTSPFTEFHPLPAAGNMLIGNFSPSPCLQNSVAGVGTPADCPTIGKMNLRPNQAYSGTSPAITCLNGTESGIQCNRSNGITGFPTTGINGDTWMLGTSSTCGNGQAICASFAGAIFPAGLYTRLNGGTSMAAYGSAPLVTITGTGFGTPGTATINGAALASVTSWSTTQIVGVPPATMIAAPTTVSTVVTPSGGGTGTVTSVVMSLTATGAAPFTPGIIAGGASLGINGPPATHDRTGWTSPPNVGAY